MELPILTQQGKTTDKKITLDKSIFGLKPNNHVIYLDIKRILASQRQGTHKTKERSEVSGSRRKIQKQKGTGNARKGDIKSNILRGGGRVFGPKDRKYNISLTKKTRKLACKVGLSSKAQETKVVQDFTLEPKTKNYLNFLTNLGLQGKKTLLILPESNKNINYATKNLPKTKVITVEHLNTYQVLDADYLIFTEKSLPLIHQKLK